MQPHLGHACLIRKVMYKVPALQDQKGQCKSLVKAIFGVLYKVNLFKMPNIAWAFLI
jgi:hypothetical protein